jgi:hypothetical protein
MLRSRIIRPGIATNEDLANLGPHATLLFERLWMLADREGRLEDRPGRIRAEVFPYWPDVPVENLLQKLAESGFIQRYKTRDKRALVQIIEFRKHQYVHQHEAKSVLPAPRSKSENGASRRKRQTSPQDKNVSNVRTCLGDAETWDTNGDTCTLVSFSFLKPKSGGGEYTSPVECAPVEKSPPQNLERTQTQTPRVERKAPGRAEEHRGKTAHASDDVALMRESLAGLADQVGMPPPDDALVERVLDAGQGASAAQIHGALVALCKRNKFREMRSWGFVPIVVADCFRARCG